MKAKKLIYVPGKECVPPIPADEGAAANGDERQRTVLSSTVGDEGGGAISDGCGSVNSGGGLGPAPKDRARPSAPDR